MWAEQQAAIRRGRSLRAGSSLRAGPSMLTIFRNELGALALAHKLPAICEWSEMAAAGCLASYGTSLRELYSTLAETQRGDIERLLARRHAGPAAHEVRAGD